MGPVDSLWILFFPGTDSAFPVLAGLGSLCGGHGTASACWAVLLALGYFLAWGKVPASLMSLVALPGRAGMLLGLRCVTGLGGVYEFGDCQQIWRLLGCGSCCQLGRKLQGLGDLCVRCMLLG